MRRSTSHGGVCDVPATCCNCKGDHPASSTSCPIYIKIITDRATKKENRNSRKNIRDAAPTYLPAPPPTQNAWANRGYNLNGYSNNYNQNYPPLRTINNRQHPFHNTQYENRIHSVPDNHNQPGPSYNDRPNEQVRVPPNSAVVNSIIITKVIFRACVTLQHH